MVDILLVMLCFAPIFHVISLIPSFVHMKSLWPMMAPLMHYGDP